MFNVRYLFFAAQGPVWLCHIPQCLYKNEDHPYSSVVVAWLGELELSKGSVVQDTFKAPEKYCLISLFVKIVLHRVKLSFAVYNYLAWLFVNPQGDNQRVFVQPLCTGLIKKEVYPGHICLARVKTCSLSLGFLKRMTK